MNMLPNCYDTLPNDLLMLTHAYSVAKTPKIPVEPPDSDSNSDFDFEFEFFLASSIAHYS